MTMPEIISQIDAYLSRLQLARDILAKSLPPAKRKVKWSTPKKTGPCASYKTQQPASSRSQPRLSPRTGAQKRVVSVVHIPSSPTPQAEDGASLADLASITVPEKPALPGINTGPLPSLPDISKVLLPLQWPQRIYQNPAHARSESLRANEGSSGSCWFREF